MQLMAEHDNFDLLFIVKLLEKVYRYQTCDGVVSYRVVLPVTLLSTSVLSSLLQNFLSTCTKY